MSFLAFVGLLFVVLSAGIVLVGAPFVPTKKTQIQVALELLDLKRGQVLYDLGAGDGRVALAAAKKGIRVIGYELNILLFLLAYIRTRKYRRLVTVKLQDYWRADFTKCDGIFIFSSSHFMKRLDEKLRTSAKGTKLASFAFEVPGKKYLRKKDGIFLYEY